MNTKPSLVAAVSAVLVLLFAGSATAQTATNKKAIINKTRDLINRLPPQQQKLLSSGARRILQVAQVLNDDHSKMGDAGTITISPKVAGLAAAIAPLAPIPGHGPGGTTRVSDPRLDFVNSVTTGFTQSETSSAWCGNTVVAGYNDSGAFLRTAGVNFDAAWSFNGVSVSVNGGKSFVDLGFLNPGIDPLNFLSGDP